MAAGDCIFSRFPFARSNILYILFYLSRLLVLYDIDEGGEMTSPSCGILTGLFGVLFDPSSPFGFEVGLISS